MNPEMIKTEEGHNAYRDSTGVTTYLPTKKDLEELSFNVDDMFVNDVTYSSRTGNLSFKMTNCGTDWKVYLTVKDGMFINTTTCWIIHPTCKKDVQAIITSFTQCFVHRNGGTS